MLCPKLAHLLYELPFQAQQQEDEKVEEISYFAYEEIKQPVSGPYRLRFDANRMRKNNDVGYKPLS
jgi:hypothetical protein